MTMSPLPFKTLHDIDTGATPTVLVRASLNVPIVDGEVKNQFRITRGVATINYLHEHGCKVVLLGHIGSDGETSTEPIAVLLESMGYDALHCKAVSGAEAKNCIEAASSKQIVVLENVRKDPREKKNDAEFARELADLADVYVNDAFAAAHREHASLVGVTEYMPSYAGFNFVHEYEALLQMREPAHPALFLLGGAKFDTKLPLVEQFFNIYDHVFIGGALAHDFFKAKGYEVGQSLVSDVDLSGSPLVSHPKLLLPVDVIVECEGSTRICRPDEVGAKESIMDAGPETTAMLQPLIADAKHILWNGPFGNYEAGYPEQTLATAKLLAAANGHVVVGGGDTVASIEELCIQEKFAFLSTAGGAMLHFLEFGTVPAIEALRLKG